ncbi:M23 family metallopeptidase [Microbacterium sp. LRZ72]|uniref:murein hydrolase activator EnvC family protein n=1 Tax=Microbacterium sp. LRZ72 TaxID=2942481 RepID=UPI0029A0B055|nr:M23 family metallopeptidase [Microbacterium sp. LRZ72]MDX2375564.1 M23 family metallopeptidase [Microbacterium sp. LRZ72]
MRQRRVVAAASVAVALALGATPPGAAAAITTSPRSGSHGISSGVAADEGRWGWPVEPPYRLARPFQAPPHAYGAGHRGVDVASRGGDTVRAPADGVVAFAGTVVDRGVVTIDHGAGLVSSMEPVSPLAAAGDRVARGDVVATLSTGGHTEHGLLHLGARLDGEYVDPLALLGGIPRAVLLPLE